MIDLVQQERDLRTSMWNRLIGAGGPRNVAPSVLRDLGIYGGAQGIWVDKARTAGLTRGGTGATVAVLHTGSAYADDLASDGALYHYPSTGRPPARDRAEVEATKATRELGLPVFVVTYPHPDSSVRDVRIGWVEEWDDRARIFLISFGEQPPPRQDRLPDPESPFDLIGGRRGKKREVEVRDGQPRFKFNVLKRYGPQCAVCDLDVPLLLDAAHLCPKNERGTDDPRNGLVLCPVHHRALDGGLFGIEPETGRLHFRAAGPGADNLRITRESLTHLPALPHRVALDWCWRRWTNGQVRPAAEAVQPGD